MNKIAIVALTIIFPVLIITAYNLHSESVSNGSNWVVIESFENGQTISIDKKSIDKSQSPTKAFVQFAYLEFRESSITKEKYNRDVFLIDFYCETKPVKMQVISNAHYLDDTMIVGKKVYHDPEYAYPDTLNAKMSSFVCS